MAKKTDEQHDADLRTSSAEARREAGAGPPPKMKRKEYEREMRVRQQARGYTEPDLPLRHIPTPF
jgi:hypothetical protein